MRGAVAHLAGPLMVGVATGLLPPSRWPPVIRRGLPLATALGTGAAAYVVLGTRNGTGAAVDPEGERPRGVPADPDDSLPAPSTAIGTRLALAFGVGVLAGASSAAGLELDGVLERSLARRGARHPRVWVGVTAVLVSELLQLGDPSEPAVAAVAA